MVAGRSNSQPKLSAIPWPPHMAWPHSSRVSSEVVRFDAGKAHINGCLGCNGCWSNNHACCHEDGFWALEPLLESCDALARAEALGWVEQFAAPGELLAHPATDFVRRLVEKERRQNFH